MQVQLAKAMNYVLGLDLGITSIGWAVIELDGDGVPYRLINANSRIFLSMVEAKTKIPKNKNRRDKRSMRKQVSRYKSRRSTLLELLHRHQFFGDETYSPQNWEDRLNQIGNPFQLRAQALDSALSLIQLARVFLHLLRRRGYQSNRGIQFKALLEDLTRRGIQVQLDETEASDVESAQGDEAARETGIVLHGLRMLRQAMADTEWKNGVACQSIAQLMLKLQEKDPAQQLRRPHTYTQTEISTKGKAVEYHLYASRDMLEEEFAKIWQVQATAHPEIMTDQLKIDIFKAIFSQRPLKIQRKNVGSCSFMIEKRRAAKALLEAQEFLMLETVNHLKYSLPKIHGEQALTLEAKHALLAALADPKKLNPKQQLSWTDAKKVLGLPAKAKFNMEASAKSGLNGNRTHLAMLNAIGGHWHNFGNSKLPGESFSQLQRQLINDLLFVDDKLALFRRLTNFYQLPAQRNPWNFSHAQAWKLVTLELDEGYVKHCIGVINKLLPPMREGAIYSDAVQLAGFLRRDQLKNVEKRTLDAPPEVANPIVQKALFETRRVVNELIAMYGKPKLIRVEMARDMKASKQHRKEINERQTANKKNNDAAALAIKALAKQYPDLGIRVSREAIIKYKLWNEQGKSCAYSYSETTHDKPIVLRNLFDGSVEVDHIYPRSLSLDDSVMNKVLCFRAENQEKGQRTPWEAWHNTEKYEAILKRFDRANLPKFPSEKLRRLKDDQFDPQADFVSAQLNDTRYMCVAVRNYLATLGYNDQELQVTRGQMTAELRKLWHLQNVLPRTNDSIEESAEPANDASLSLEENEEAVSEEAGASKEKKKDRGDHRHHAVDAIVTALVDRKVFADLMARYRYLEKTGRWPKEDLPCSVPNLRDAAEKILLSNVVSHASNRKVWGGLHDELPYGLGTYQERDVPLKTLLKQGHIFRCEPDGRQGKSLQDGSTWISDVDLREVLRNWFDGYEKIDKAKQKHYPPPILADGKVITKVDLTHRCYVKRMGIDTALAKVDINPGKKTWIVDQGVRTVLQEWLLDHKVKDAVNNPPRMPRKDRDKEKAHPIRSVRLASLASGMVQFKKGPQIFAKGSNHHVAIFKKICADGSIERRGIFVDMLEAARRIRAQPIVRKDPAQLKAIDPEIDPSEWRFEMALCSQDMVEWDANEVPESHKRLGPPVYRLQKMSGVNQTLVFRHFSVTSSSDTDRRGLIQCGPNSMYARKIRMSNTGNWEVIQHD